MFNNEEKKYSIIGKVEIGTDEYRDLIEAVKDSERKYNDEYNTRWKEFRRAEEAEKRVKELQGELEPLKNFINSSEELKTKFKLYLIEQTDKVVYNE